MILVECWEWEQPCPGGASDGSCSPRHLPFPILLHSLLSSNCCHHSPLKSLTPPPVLVSEYFAAVTILHSKAPIFLAARPTIPQRLHLPSLHPHNRSHPAIVTIRHLPTFPFLSATKANLVIARSTRGLHVTYLPTHLYPHPHHTSTTQLATPSPVPLSTERASVTTSSNA